MKIKEKINLLLRGNGELAAITAVIALALVFTAVFSYKYGVQWVDSDHSSEMILGQLLARENKLLSRNWLYSTELRLVYQTIFTMPLFKLLEHTGNWALIRALNILLNNVTLILSYLFLTHNMKIKLRWSLISSVFLLIPLSFTYWNIVTFGGYYIFFIAQLFICLGLFIPLTSGEKSKLKYLIPYLILSFVLGVQGVRSPLAVNVPLLLTCLYIWLGRKKEPVLLGLYGFLACGAGYIVNNLLHKWYSFKNFTNMEIDNLDANLPYKLSRSLVNIAGYFGFTYGNQFFSVRGLFSIAAIIAAFLLFFVLYKIFKGVKRQNTQVPPPYQFISVFFFISMTLNIFIFIIISQNIVDRFFIPFMVLYIPFIAAVFEQIKKNYTPVKRGIIICGIILFIAGQGGINYYTLIKKDINSDRKGYIQYLLDNNYRFGFASFWNANITTELSGGKIEMVGLGSQTRTENVKFSAPNDILIPVQFLDPHYNRGKTFLLLTNYDWEVKKRSRTFSNVKPDYEDGNFTVVSFPYREVLQRALEQSDR